VTGTGQDDPVHMHGADSLTRINMAMSLTLECICVNAFCRETRFVAQNASMQAPIRPLSAIDRPYVS
jgi:hypothetical protein